MVLIVMIIIIVYLALKAFQKEVMEIELFNKKRKKCVVVLVPSSGTVRFD